MQSYWTSCEVEQRVQTCIFSVPTFDNSIHPFYVQVLPPQAGQLIQHDSFAYQPNCDLENVCWSWVVWALLNERLKWWWFPLLNGNGMMLDKLKDGEYWRLPAWSNLKFEQSLDSDTFWSLSLKRSLTKLHVQTIVWKISDQVWLCHDGLKRWGLAQARHSRGLIQRYLIDSKSFFYCKTNFQ